MDPYEAWLREVLQLAGEIYFRRVEAELWKVAEAIDQWLHELFAHPRPDWRESFDQLLAQQEAEGRLIEPKSRQELLDFLEGWAGTVDWNTAASQTASDDREVVVLAAPERTWQSAGQEWFVGGPPRDRGRTLSGGHGPFLRGLQAAKGHLVEMHRVLEALGQELDAAEVREEVEVESAVDAIEALIWQYNDAMEKARDLWLRYDLDGDTYNQLESMSTPVALGLPRFVDEQQAVRAEAQAKRITKRLNRRVERFDQIIFGMQAVEAAGTAASLALGAGVVLTAVKQGGKWAVVKTVAKVAASGAAAYGAGEAVEGGLRAAGTSEETIHGVRLAAEVVTWLLLLRRVRTARAKPAPQPERPVAPKQPQVGSSGSSQPADVSPGTGLVPTAPVVLGEWGEIRLRHLFGGRGFKPKSAYKTSYGKRFIDWMVDGVAHESKAGLNVGLTSKIREQALKDAELIKRKRVKGAHWHFFQGARKELLDFLASHGIQYTVH